MPMGTYEQLAKWKSDEYATDFLLSRGYKLAADWTWIAPGQPDELELEAIEFMADEFDYGWWRHAK